MKTRVFLFVLIALALATAVTVFRRGDEGHPASAETARVERADIAAPAGRGGAGAAAMGTDGTAKDCCPQQIIQVANPGGDPSIATAPKVARPESLKAIEDFQKWAERFGKASVAEQARMKGEGVALAEARRETFAGLIKYDPKAAIEAMLPYAVRKSLPEEIAQKIEHPVRGRGPLRVIGVMPAPGQPTPDEPIFRTAKVKEKEYRVYTYGRRLEQRTTEDTRLLGVGVELADGKRVMALREEPYEVLSKDEAADVKAEQGVSEALCPISGEETEVKGDETAVDVGGEVIWLCSGGHVSEWLKTPDGLQIMYAGGSGNSGGSSPVVPATHAQGNKKFLAIRVRFSNQAANFEPASDATMQSEMQTTVNNFASWSYQKLHSTFAFTPVLTMPQADTWYAANGTENKLRDDALAAAAAYDDGTGAHPYDPANFDFPCIVYSTGAFGNYCGIASIGGNWNLVKCASASVIEHEYGHNFGLLHANRWEPSTDSPIGPGEHIEYGSPKSVMGSGGHAFNTIERWTLQWLTAADVVTVGASGTYRLFNADKSTLTASNPYAIRVRKDSRTYSIEFRPTQHGNGVLIAWDQSGSQLLDMTPLTSGGQGDAHLLIGRTFSDYAQGLHITPIATGGSSPDQYTDVVVSYDAGPSNAAPVGVLTASNLAPATSANITLTMTASDPDGDALAYSWDFGDGNFSTNNNAVQTKSWGTAGKYFVRCAASDRRGKTVVKSVVVTVGSAGTFAITGRVAKADGTGVPDVLMRVNGSNAAHTDSDGRYAIVRMPAGNHTVTALHDGWAFSQNFSNPVTLGPDAVERNFTATTVPGYGGISTEVFTGISGNNVSNLTSAASYIANTPNIRYTFDGDFEAVENFAENYGQRARGFFKAPTTGNYNFYIATDDGGELWMNTTGESPAGRVKIAQVNNFVNSRDYTAQANQKSAAIALTAGQRYYIEALHKEGGGGDHLSVGVDLPGGAQERPIPASRLDPFYTANPTAPANTITISATDAAASEVAGDTGTFTLTRTGATTSALTVYFDVGGSATYGSDFNATGLSATFAAGSATSTVTVTPVDDAAVESAETVVLTLSAAPALYTLGATTTATVTIDDNEAAAVTITATDAQASEGGVDTGTFTVTRTGSTSAALAVNFTIGGSATNGTDYTTITSPVTIPAGQSSATITLSAVNDGAFEVAETAVLTLASGSYSIGSPSAATVTIAAAVGTGGGILREWWDGISATNFVYDLTNIANFPNTPTGREIITTEFTTAQNRAENFGERWRGIFTAPITGNYIFYIASDDYSELWLSTDATPERRQKIASVAGSTPFQNWTTFASQTSAAIPLTTGQRYYIEAIFKEGVGGDHMSVGVQYPNGALERPIPAHRLDPFTATTSIGAQWTSTDIGTTGSPGAAGLGSATLSAGPRNRYSFSGTANASITDGTAITDSVAGANAVLRGAGAVFNAGGTMIDLPGGASSTQAYIDLPNGVISGTFGGGTRYTSATYEAWVNVQTAQSWSRYFDFGTNSGGEILAPGGTFSAGGTHPNVLLSAFNGTSPDPRLSRSGATINAFRDSTGATVLNTQVHIALVYDAADQNWRWFRNGVLVQVLPDAEGLTALNDVNNWLGRSNYSADANTDALYNEFRVYDYALTEAQLRGNFSAGPDAINTLNTGNTGPYLITGSGVLSTGGATDGFHFDSQPLTGDWEVRARLVSLTDAGTNAVAGLMMREGTAANARHAFIGLTPAGIGRFINRITAGGNAATTDYSGLTFPQWLRIVRSGNTIAGFVSLDGVAWTQIGATATFGGLASTLQVGFAVASGTTANTSALAQFDNLTLSPAAAGGDGFTYERFEGISGATIATLTSAASYIANTPTLRETRSGFFDVAQSNPAIDNFGERLRGWFVAPLTGNYTFYIAGDDQTELWLSTNDTAAARVKIASTPSATAYREWTKFAAQKSAAISLTAGQRYYIEVLHKEATGGDFVSVGMVMPNGAAEFPMLASRVESFTIPATFSTPWSAADVGTPGVAGSSGTFAPGYTGPGDALTLGPRHRYTFSGTASAAAADGATLVDVVGGAHGTLRGAGAVFDAAGTGLGLPGGSSGTQAYVDLPNGVATGTINGGTRFTSVSYELWFTQRTNRNWSRVLDFGTNDGGEITAPGGSFSGTNFIMLSGNIGAAQNQRLARTGSAGTNFGTTRDSYGATQLNQLAHVVVQYDAATTTWRWYRNGQLMGSIIDTSGMSGIDDMNVWLGRSNFAADQNLDAVLHEFRIYNYALTPQQVLANSTLGADVVNTTDNALPRAPKHRWTMSGAASAAAADGTWLYDKIGGANALVRGAGATFDASGAGVTLPGGASSTQAYIDLPNGVASGTYNGGARFTNVTFEAWATQSSNQTWSRLWDFGASSAGEFTGPGGSGSGTNYLHLAANNALTQNPRLRRFAGASDAAVNVTGATQLNQLVHHVVAYNAPAQQWTWYANGVLLATLADTEGVATLADVNNFLGRSQFTADANWAGTMHEFRIYDYALTADQVLANLDAGPDAMNVAAPGLAGSAVVTGGGAISTSSTSDNFQFASQTMDGDGEIIARVAGLQNVNSSALAGVMIRDGSAAGARHVFIGLTPAGNGRYIRRATTSGTAASTTINSTTFPYWVRLVRKADAITGYTSPDGSSWTAQTTVNFAALPINVLAGLAVSSNNTGVADANFDNVQIIRPTVTISATTNAAEPAQNGAFTVTRTWDTTSALAVSYTVGGSATNGADYQTLSGTVTIPAGASSAPLNITTIDDAANEASETVAVTLVDAAGYILGAQPSDTLTLAGPESTFIFNNLTTGTSHPWTTGTNWLGSVAPASGAGSQLEFFIGQTLPSGTITANNNNAGTFQLGAVRLAGTGPASGTATVAINGNPLHFHLPGGSLALETTNGTGATMNVQTALTLAATTAVTGSGTATFLVSGDISGAGGFDKTGSATLILTGNNSYAGGTTIGGGTVRAGNNTATGSLGTGPIASGGTVHFHRSDTALNVGSTISGTGGLQFGVSTGGTLGAITTLSGANTFTGGVTVNSGGVRITNSSALGAGSKTVTMSNGTAGNPNLRLDGSGGAITLPATIAFTTSNATNAGAIVNEAGNNSIAGDFTLASGGGDTRITSNAGTLTLSGTFTPNTTNRGVILGGAGSGVVSGTIQNGSGANTLARLDKVDAGTWTLSGTATHTGTAIVTAGTLLVNGSITAASSVTVAAAGTLGGTGTITPATTINGVHNPGDGFGTQTFNGALGYSATGRLKWELSANSVAAGTFDKVTANAAVTLTSGAAVDLVLNRAGSAVDVTDAFWTQNRSWHILTATSMSGTFGVGTLSTDIAGRNVSNYGAFTLTHSATAITLNWTAFTATETWQRIHFGANWNNPAISGDTADPDKDGRNNLLERALNGNPNANDASLVQQTTAGGKLTILLTRVVANTDLTLTVQAADSPAGPWIDLARSTAGAAFTVITAGTVVNETGTGSTRSVEVRDIYQTTDPAHPQRYLRIHVLR